MTYNLLHPLVLAKCLVLTSLALSTCQWAVAQSLDGLSEKDFLSDMPVILSVSRLPQRLDDTPGAVTILDRDMIRRSGARDVADLLRLVPGFQTSASFEGVAPLASYHGGFDSFSNRMQLLIDGRSAYSPYFIGTVAPGMQTVAMQDIERIEVLRGSNSAAYGARAVLGVINIVTRHTGDTLGTQVSVAAGENSIRDAQARLGWGQEGATYRLTLDRRSDGGLAGANGHNALERFNFRADLNPNATDEIQLRTGGMEITSGRGLTNPNGSAYVGNPPRDSSFGASYAQLDWRRSLGEDEDLAFSVSHTREFYRDSFPYDLRVFRLNGIYTVDIGGRAQNDTVSLQHTFRQGPGLRVVWGGEFRREQVTSAPLYNTAATFETDFTRLFGNAEWRLHPDLVLNAGAMAENSSDSGDSFAPRIMLNWHPTPGQTLRAGVSRGYRPPSTFEKYADVRYVFGGRLLDVSVLSSGNLKPESVLARELGYMLEAPQVGLGLDVRAFHEQINGFIEQLNDNPRLPRDYANVQNFAIRGLEYQLKWRPWQGAELNFNQAYIDISSDDLATQYAAPKRATTLAFFQKLPHGVELALTHQDSGKVKPQATSAGGEVAMKRTDVRISAPLQLGRHRGELAVVIQNLGAPYKDFRPQFTFERQAFMTLTFEN